MIGSKKNVPKYVVLFWEIYDMFGKIKKIKIIDFI